MARPIDADKLIPKATYMYGFSNNKYISLKAIEQAPTITFEDLRPHDKWIEHECIVAETSKLVEYECPRCTIHSAVKTNFCPKCGTKMDLT